MAPTFGSLLVLLPLYGYWYSFLIFVVIILIPFIITRNVALSMGAGLLFLPLIIWLTTRLTLPTVLIVVLGVMIAIKFLPTAKAAWARNSNARAFIFDDGRQKNQVKE